MHETICTFPSKTLYGGRLRSDASVARHLLQDLENIRLPASGGSGEAAVSTTDEDELLRTPVAFFDTAGCEYFEKSGEEGEGDEGSKCNENEATLVKNWIVKLVRASSILNEEPEDSRDAIQVAAGVQPSQIAVLTPSVNSPSRLLAKQASHRLRTDTKPK